MIFAPSISPSYSWDAVVLRIVFAITEYTGPCRRPYLCEDRYLLLDRVQDLSGSCSSILDRTLSGRSLERKRGEPRREDSGKILGEKRA